MNDKTCDTLCNCDDCYVCESKRLLNIHKICGIPKRTCVLCGSDISHLDIRCQACKICEEDRGIRNINEDGGSR